MHNHRSFVELSVNEKNSKRVQMIGTDFIRGEEHDLHIAFQRW